MGSAVRSPETATVITAGSQDTLSGTVRSAGHSQSRAFPGQSSLSQGHQATSSESGAVTSEATSQVEYLDYEGVSDEMFEYEQNDQISVKSRLKEHLEFWQNELPTNEFYNTLKFGYVIPFEMFPPKIILKNNRSSVAHSEFVVTAISELLRNKCVVEVTSPYIVIPLTVSVSASGKKRLALDLRHVNKYVEKQKVKFEGVKEALEYAREGLYMIKFDLKSGYHHIDIHPEFQKYLGFAWEMDGRVRFYEFTVLPFGLSSAGHIFTKVVRVLVNYWRSFGIPIIVYLDDGWVCEQYQRCVDIAKFLRKTLHMAGFLVNEDKYKFDPSDQLTWLGFKWNLQKGTIEVPIDKIHNIYELLSYILSNQSDVSARKLASFVGKIISLKPALGNICQLMTRKLCMLICCRRGWDYRISISDACVQELRFWYDSLKSLPFNKLVVVSSVPEQIVFSDASAFAGAGFTYEKHSKIVHYMWNELEQSESSTWRELKTVLLIVQSLQSLLSGKLVKIYTDNQNTVRIATKGSMSEKLHQLAMEMFKICIRYSIRVELEWIPRDLNVLADECSKIFDWDDWGVADRIFNLFDRKWGIFTCDVFANSQNSKVHRFYSKFWTPNTAGVDAFAFDWSRDNCWIVPPPSLVCRTIQHLRICKARGVLVIPKWKSAVFWPAIWDEDFKHISIFCARCGRI